MDRRLLCVTEQYPPLKSVLHCSAPPLQALCLFVITFHYCTNVRLYVLYISGLSSLSFSCHHCRHWCHHWWRRSHVSHTFICSNVLHPMICSHVLHPIICSHVLPPVPVLSIYNSYPLKFSPAGLVSIYVISWIDFNHIRITLPHHMQPHSGAAESSPNAP